MTTPTVFWPLLVTFGHILTVSNQIILPAETTITEEALLLRLPFSHCSRFYSWRAELDE